MENLSRQLQPKGNLVKSHPEDSIECFCDKFVQFSELMKAELLLLLLLL